MMQRRTFLKHTGLATAGMAASALLPVFATDLGINSKNKTMEQVQNSGYHKRFRPNSKVGFGGVALGNGFNVNPDVECLQSMEAAWDAGVRYFDTSPWYGLGISERRMGLFLKDQQREDYSFQPKSDESFIRMMTLNWKRTGKVN